jgi:hypothetical protein
MAKKPTTQLPADLPELLSPAQAAAFLTLSVAQLAAWRVKGMGPKFSRLGKRRLVYPLADLRAFVAENLGKGA